MNMKLSKKSLVPSKKVIIILALAIVCGGASAQQKQGHTRIPISRNIG